MNKLSSSQLVTLIALALGTFLLLMLMLLVSAYNANELLTERSNTIATEMADFCKDQPHGVIVSSGLHVVCSSMNADGNPIDIHLKLEQE